MCNDHIHNLAIWFSGEWEFREIQQDVETQLPVEKIGTKNSRRDMFRAELRLIEYPGNILHCSLENTFSTKLRYKNMLKRCPNYGEGDHMFNPLQLNINMCFLKACLLATVLILEREFIS